MTRRGTGQVPTTPTGAPAPELARGRTSVVYDLGDGTVLRRCLDPRADVRAEAIVMEHARAHGVPTPAVLDVAGPDLVMERVPGPTMLNDLMADPSRAGDHGRLLADLHRTLDAVPPLGHGLSAGERLLHLDLHPGNVLLSDAGPVLVDWTNAGHGPRPLDVATTWVVLACLGAAETGAPSQDTVRATLLDGFLEHVDRRAAETYVARAAEARLVDPATSADERRALTGFLAG